MKPCNDCGKTPTLYYHKYKNIFCKDCHYKREHIDWQAWAIVAFLVGSVVVPGLVVAADWVLSLFGSGFL